MKARGFTLIELITVMVLIGILAVAALPRFFDQNVFEARGFLDETKSLLRYAQKAAVAQRRTVCVALNANGVVLTIASAPGVNACNTALALPNSKPRGGVLLAAKAAGVPIAAFQFRSLGDTNQADDVIVTIANATGKIIVDHTTGYVY